VWTFVRWSRQSVADFKEKLGRKKEEAIVALVSQRSIEDAARACNIPVRTLYRWLKDPEFDAAYRAARRQAYGQSISRLQQGSTRYQQAAEVSHE
jgi:hypothetical protein